MGAHGEGVDPDAAVADLYEALTGLVAEYGAPNELTVALTAT